MKLRTKLYLGTLTVFGLLSVVISVITVIHVNESVIQLSEDRVRLDINSARLIFDSRQAKILYGARLLAKEAEAPGPTYDDSKFSGERIDLLRRKLEGVKADSDQQLDILLVLDPSGKVILRTGGQHAEAEIISDDQLVNRVVRSREAASGVILLPRSRLEAEGAPILRKCLQNGGEARGMFMGAAVPLITNGEFWGILEAGIILNGATDKVDAIRDLVFEKKLYEGKPVGTATLFLDDLRISTNVLDGRGLRAIGTRAAPEIAEHVLKKGLPWDGPALVVDTTYISRYEPVRDPDQNIIGMLYVGVLEELYRDMRTRAVISYLLALMGGLILSMLGLIPLYRSILQPIRKLSFATKRISEGDFGYRVGIESKNELGSLSRAFDRMAAELQEQRKVIEEEQRQIEEEQRQIEQANEELRVLNRNYMELLGFVSHELKNPLASAIMGLYSVKDEYLGGLTDSQKRVLDSVGRSLDYFKEIIKSYLDLSRLEKGEIQVHKAVVPLRPIVIDPTVEGLQRAIEAKGMVLENRIPAEMVVEADKDLLRIVLDNLLSNAIKYGREGGALRIEARETGAELTLDVYNEGEGVPQDKIPLLFRKFSRVRDPRFAEKKGTGLGLYICKEIVEKHGGRISVASEEGKWIRFTVALPRPTAEIMRA